MTTIALPKNDASKAEEIAFLTKLSGKLSPLDLYIRDLFSLQFVAWIENQIRNDFPPDVIMHFEGLQDQINEKSSELIKLGDRVRFVERELQYQKTEHEYELHRINDKFEINRTKNVELERQARENQTAYVELNTKFWQAQDEIIALQGFLNDQHDEINALKARLYDLENK